MVVVFDGVCNLCNGWVAFVIRRDPRGRFRFAAAQGAAGRALLAEAGLGVERLDTLLLVDGARHYERSEAVLRILEQLGAAWPLARALRWLPRGWRDRCYDAVARRRYRLFGRSDSCRAPAAALRDRFLA